MAVEVENVAAYDAREAVARRVERDGGACFFARDLLKRMFIEILHKISDGELQAAVVRPQSDLWIAQRRDRPARLGGNQVPIGGEGEEARKGRDA